MSKDIISIWKDEKTGNNVDYDADLASLKHQAQGEILKLEGEVRNAARGVDITIAKSRGKEGAFAAILCAQEYLACATEALSQAKAAQTALFGE